MCFSGMDVSEMYDSSPAAVPTSDQSVLLSKVNTPQNEGVNNLVYSVPNQTVADGVFYEVMASEEVAPVVAAFANDGQYNKLQRDTLVLTQSTTASITGDGRDDVEAYYGKLDNTEQYIVSSEWCEWWYVGVSVLSLSCESYFL